MPQDRLPQINFQVQPSLKTLYDEARESGHWVTRFCAAGLLLLVEEPGLRLKALNRLRDWEAEFEDASPTQIRAFVQGAAGAMQGGARGSRRGRKAQPAKKKAKRS